MFCLTCYILIFLCSSAAIQEKRGHRESRLLENINKMVLETNEQLQVTDFEVMAQQLTDVKKRRKSPFTLHALVLFFYYNVFTA